MWFDIRFSVFLQVNVTKPTGEIFRIEFAAGTDVKPGNISSFGIGFSIQPAQGEPVFAVT